jgi:hypothetical protein
MALVFRIENNDQTDTVDLLANLRLVRSSFAPEAGMPEGLVTETFEIIDQDTAANMRTADSDLEAILEKARRFHSNRNTPESIWLRWHTDGETAKRALIYEYLKRHDPTLTAEPLMELPSIRELIAITRHPYFESLSSSSSSTTGISTLGGAWNLSGTISGGTVDGRINRFTIAAGEVNEEINMLWIGITDGEHISGAYDPVAECGSGTDIDADTSVVGTTMETTFTADADLIYRFSVTLEQFGSTTDEFIGRHLLLLRCKTDASTEIGIRASSTYFDSPGVADPKQVKSITYITNTAYQMLELGEFDIPGIPWRQELDDASPSLDDWRFAIEATRLSGTGKLYADALVLVPADHLFQWSSATFREAIDEIGVVHTDEDDHISAYVENALLPKIIEIPIMGARNWRYPHQGGYVVFVAQHTDGHDRTLTVDPSIEVMKRWLTYHG